MRRSLGMTLIAVAVMAGCSIGETERVEEVDADQLGGLDEATSSTTTTSPPAGSDAPTSTTTPGSTTTVATETIRLYFVEGSQLVAYDAEVPEDAELRRRLDLLEEGPPPQLADAGWRTALPPDLITGTALWGSDGVTVRLDDDLFNSVEDSDQRLMVGQIVLTLTDQPGIDRVDFTLDGEPLAVFLRNNTLSEPGEAVREGDYEVLLAATPLRPQTTSSAATSVEPVVGEPDLRTLNGQRRRQRGVGDRHGDGAHARIALAVVERPAATADLVQVGDEVVGVGEGAVGEALERRRGPPPRAPDRRPSPAASCPSPTRGSARGSPMPGVEAQLVRRRHVIGDEHLVARRVCRGSPTRRSRRRVAAASRASGRGRSGSRRGDRAR